MASSAPTTTFGTLLVYPSIRAACGHEEATTDGQNECASWNEKTQPLLAAAKVSCTRYNSACS